MTKVKQESASGISEEKVYLLKQKETTEQLALELCPIYRPVKLLSQIKHLILLMTSSVSCSLLKTNELSQNDINIANMIVSLQKQIVILSEKIKKLEGK